MKTSLFDFPLPEDRIATRPANPRDSARMLVVEPKGLHDASVRDLLAYLKPGDVMVFNDTRVLPARLFGMRGEARVEVLLHREIASHLNPPTSGGRFWTAFAKPAKKLKVGDTLAFDETFSAVVEGKLEDGQVVLRFSGDEAKVREELLRIGRMPLPPYIEKKRAGDAQDLTDYQTVYAHSDKTQSVAAPTAGLHFTPALLAAIKAKGVTLAHVTLHVGAGTFQPVKVDDTTEHSMHAEWAEVTKETAETINLARARGGRIVAVGTTSLRTLESASDAQGRMQPFAGDTRIFITPGYAFKCVDVLMTNFHLPKSTLFMLVSAFAGLEEMQAAYKHAIAAGYRFYSYGDACLLFRN